jgi:hypothetical protein
MSVADTPERPLSAHRTISCTALLFDEVAALPLVYRLSY